MTKYNTDMELFEKAKMGSISARNQIVADNMPFLMAVVYNYRGASLPREDLINEGSFGLIRAAEEFDPTRGIKFSSYAVWWIRSYINKALNATGSLIRIPANKTQLIRKALGEAGEDEEVSDKVQELINIEQGTVSLNTPVAEEGGTMMDIVADTTVPGPATAFNIEQLKFFASKLLLRMNPREAYVVKNLFGINMTAPLTRQELARKMHISVDRVTQLKKQGMKQVRLRNSDGYLSDTIKEYLQTAEQDRER